MSRFRTILEWSVILVPVIVLGYLGYHFFLGAGVQSAVAGGLPDTNGGFYQTPLSPPQHFSKTAGAWKFDMTSHYTYTLAGKVVGNHVYPATMPAGIIALDIAVVNGDLLVQDSLQYFTFTMGDHTLKYSYDVPTWTGLTEAYIDEHISNNHLVFLNATLENEVKAIKDGDCVIIKGKLVDIQGSSSSGTYTAHTSTVRNDAYPEGCELILVESFTPVSCGK
jgi:hypothetical protein